MNRLQSRVRRLEAAAPNDDGPGLSGVFRTLLDEYGNEIKWDCLLDPVEPPHIPPPRSLSSADLDAPVSQGPIVTSYQDKPWRMTHAQSHTWIRLMSNKSRSLHEIAFTGAEANECRCLWDAALANAGTEGR